MCLKCADREGIRDTLWFAKLSFDINLSALAVYLVGFLHSGFKFLLLFFHVAEKMNLS